MNWFCTAISSIFNAIIHLRINCSTDLHLLIKHTIVSNVLHAMTMDDLYSRSFSSTSHSIRSVEMIWIHCDRRRDELPDSKESPCSCCHRSPVISDRFHSFNQRLIGLEYDLSTFRVESGHVCANLTADIKIQGEPKSRETISSISEIRPDAGPGNGKSDFRMYTTKVEGLQVEKHRLSNEIAILKRFPDSVDVQQSSAV
jgi:hypothetical protein